MFTGFGRAHYISIHYFRQPSPGVIMFRPTVPAYWAKIFFEKYWLNRWL